MPELSDELCRQLKATGNLPASPEGIVRLRPDITKDVEEAKNLLGDISETDQQTFDTRAFKTDDNDVLIARFRALPEGIEQFHLFLMEGAQSDSDDKRLRRWSKMSVSFGSFVQVSKFLNKAWGEVSGLEVEKARLVVAR